MGRDDGLCVVECVKLYPPDPQRLDTGLPVRAIVGPFHDFEAAHRWMTRQSDAYHALIIHRLQRPSPIASGQ